MKIVLTRSRFYLLFSLLLFIFYALISILVSALNENESKTLINDRFIFNYSDIRDSLENLNWFIQVSDLHLSKFHDKSRIMDFKRFCNEDLNIIQPEVAIITGDITDAKLENEEGSAQILDEWIAYKNIIDGVNKNKKIIWLDTRGNHDAFDVPNLRSERNYFKLYSNRGAITSQSYSYDYKTKYGQIFTFVALDACPDPGPKRPFNFFAIMKPEEVANVNLLIQSSLTRSNLTITFGHYPTSVFSFPRSNHIRNVLGPSLVYMCGHFHTFGGMLPTMYAKHSSGNLELELSDWKDRRSFRIFAIDHGLFSFVDTTLDKWPIIILTNPKSALILAKHREPIELMRKSSHVRILIFSKIKIAVVMVQIGEQLLGEAKNVDGPLFVVKWDPDKYVVGLHQLIIIVKDIDEVETRSVNEFSLDGSRPNFYVLDKYAILLDHGFIVMTINISK